MKEYINPEKISFLIQYLKIINITDKYQQYSVRFVTDLSLDEIFHYSRDSTLVNTIQRAELLYRNQVIDHIDLTLPPLYIDMLRKSYRVRENVYFHQIPFEQAIQPFPNYNFINGDPTLNYYQRYFMISYQQTKIKYGFEISIYEQDKLIFFFRTHNENEHIDIGYQIMTKDDLPSIYFDRLKTYYGEPYISFLVIFFKF